MADSPNPPKPANQGTCGTAPTQQPTNGGIPGGFRGGMAPMAKQPPGQTGTSPGVKAGPAGTGNKLN